MKAAGLSETGPVRHMNEDCFVSAEDLRLFVVADGMGGHAAGEVASARRRIHRELHPSIARNDDFSWPYGIEPTLSYEANRLKTAVDLANRRINRLAENHDDYTGMGTTVVCALLAGRSARRGPRRRQPPVPLRGTRPHPADARRLLGGDHSRPQGRRQRPSRDSPRLDERARRPARHTGAPARTRAARRGHIAAVQRRPARLRTARDAANILASDEDVPAVAQSLIAAALEHGSRDNITALVVRCSGSRNGDAG